MPWTKPLVFKQASIIFGPAVSGFTDRQLDRQRPDLGYQEATP
jgi:hypothetical protein